MELKLQKEKADAFVSGMEALAKKFDKVYIPGKIEDYVKLDVVEGKITLTFSQEVPEMMRIACYMCFVDTML